MPLFTTTKGAPYPDGDDPAALLNERIQALAEWADAAHTVAFTTAQRDALPAESKWNRRRIYNSDLGVFQTWDAVGAAWVSETSYSIITHMSTATRDALGAGDKPVGRVIRNTTYGLFERWNGTVWEPQPGQMIAAAYRAAGAAQSFPNNISTAIQFNADWFDPYGLHDLVTNTHAFQIPADWTSGYYRAVASSGWAVNATGYRQLDIRGPSQRFGSVTRAGDALQSNRMQASAPHILATASQSIYAEATQNTGGAYDMENGLDVCWMTLERVS